MSGDRYVGSVKWFNNTKGYGFIALDSGKEVFVHYSSIRGGGYKTLDEGERVELAVEEDGKGPRAADVVRLNPPAAKPASRPPHSSSGTSSREQSAR
jgi:cold shock protein